MRRREDRRLSFFDGLTASPREDSKRYSLSLYGGDGSRSNGVHISQSLSTPSLSNRQHPFSYTFIMPQRYISLSNSQREVAHKFDCYDELRWDQACA
jgi:hypothetical protein